MPSPFGPLWQQGVITAIEINALIGGRRERLHDIEPVPNKVTFGLSVGADSRPNP